jgi:hypothetical protein
MLERSVWIALGVLFMCGSYFATRVGPPFSRSGGHPPNRPQRVILFLLGFVAFAHGAFGWFSN